jgi:Glycosyl transferases group 1
MVEAAADLPDLFHVHHAGLLSRVSPAVAAKIYCACYPITDLRGPAAPTTQHLRGAFVGGINWANMSRLVWWAEIARLGLPVDLYPTLSLSQRSPQQYAELVSAYAVTVNLTTRANGRRILTGRSLEAPIYGSLLLEEATDDTAYFMRPFEHYVPFDNLAELVTRLHQLLGDAPLRETIARAGSAWARQQFGALHFFARLFWHLDRIPARPPALRQHRFRPSRVVVPTANVAVYHAFQQAQEDASRDG